MEKEVRVLIKDEIHCRIVGISPHDLLNFYDEYGFYAENYRWDKNYKAERWDGKIRFFKKTGDTFVYFLREILVTLKKLGYSFTIVDRRRKNLFRPEPINSEKYNHILYKDNPTIIRYYQKEAIDALTTHGNGIFLGGTGAGKTLLTAALVDAYVDIPFICIVPSITLANQTGKVFKMLGIDVGYFHGECHDLNHKHVLATWQTLKNYPNVMMNYGGLLVDECHDSKTGNILYNLGKEYGKNMPYRFGLTATLPENACAKNSIHTILGPVRYEKPAHELIKEGFLSTLMIQVIRLEEEKEKKFPDYLSEKHYLQNDEIRLNWIKDFIIKLSNQYTTDNNTLILINGIDFGRRMARLVPNSVFLYGEDPIAVREQYYNMFDKEHDMIVFANARIAGIGLDIDRIFNLIYIDIGKSFIGIPQFIGRGLRKNSDKGKEHLRVFDICSSLKFAGKHLGKRKSRYKQNQYPFEVTKLKYRTGKQSIFDI